MVYTIINTHWFEPEIFLKAYLINYLMSLINIQLWISYRNVFRIASGGTEK